MSGRQEAHSQARKKVRDRCFIWYGAAQLHFAEDQSTCYKKQCARRCHSACHLHSSEILPNVRIQAFSLVKCRSPKRVKKYGSSCKVPGGITNLKFHWDYGKVYSLYHRCRPKLEPVNKSCLGVGGSARKASFETIQYTTSKISR